MALSCRHLQHGKKMSRVFLAIFSTSQQHQQPTCQASTASTEAKPLRLSNNLSFREAYDSHLPPENRPLVLLYGWLVAKAKHIHKYGDFYLKKGFDVLHIKVNPTQLVWPQTSQEIIRGVLDFATEPQRRDQPVLVHGFSVGGYLYGETLVKIGATENDVNNMHKSAEKPEYAQMTDRIQAQIFDSPVDYHGIPYGISNAVAPIPVIQKSMQWTLEAYLATFKKSVTQYYHRSSNTFISNHLKLPTLLLYSEKDKIADDKRIEEVAENWRSNGTYVEMKKWIESPHVSHFHLYPMEYITALNSFLEKVGLVTTQKEHIVMHS